MGEDKGIQIRKKNPEEIKKKKKSRAKYLLFIPLASGALYCLQWVMLRVSQAQQ